ncbi:hypothetical protein C7E12_23300, partial [Stenotrophomonas maltophilia]
RNQYNTAAALDSLPQSGAALGLYNTVLMYDAGTARSAQPVQHRRGAGQPAAEWRGLGPVQHGADV